MGQEGQRRGQRISMSNLAASFQEVSDLDKGSEVGGMWLSGGRSTPIDAEWTLRHNLLQLVARDNL